MTSPSTAPNLPAKPSKKFAWWYIVLFALALIVLLALLFPQQLFLRTLINSNQPNAASVLYLRNLLALHPDNSELALALVQQEFALGDHAAAEHDIAPYLTATPQTTLQWKTLWIYYQIVRAQTYALLENNPERRNREAALAKLLSQLAASPLLTANNIAQLAQDALALDQVQLAMGFYRLAAQHPESQSASFFAQAGKTALFVSDYAASAQFYLLAMQKSGTIDLKRDYFAQAINSLAASGHADAIITFANAHIDGLAQDKATLLLLAKTALRADRPDRAQEYIREVLQLQYQTRPEDKQE